MSVTYFTPSRTPSALLKRLLSLSRWPSTRFFSSALVLPGVRLINSAARSLILPRGTHLAKSLQFPVFFTRLGVYQFCCTCVPYTSSVALSFYIFLTLSLRWFLEIFWSRSSSVLPDCSSADTAQPGTLSFVLEPIPYRILHCKAISDSLLVYPAFGSKKNRFFAGIAPVLFLPQASSAITLTQCKLSFQCLLLQCLPILPDIADSSIFT